MITWKYCWIIYFLKIKVRIPNGEVAEKEGGGLAIIQNQNLNVGLKFEEIIKDLYETVDNYYKKE